jgi:hypothetical protein
VNHPLSARARASCRSRPRATEHVDVSPIDTSSCRIGCAGLQQQRPFGNHAAVARYCKSHRFFVGRVRGVTGSAKSQSAFEWLVRRQWSQKLHALDRRYRTQLAHRELPRCCSNDPRQQPSAGHDGMIRKVSRQHRMISLDHSTLEVGCKFTGGCAVCHSMQYIKLSPSFEKRVCGATADLPKLRATTVQQASVARLSAACLASFAAARPPTTKGAVETPDRLGRAGL